MSLVIPWPETFVVPNVGRRQPPGPETPEYRKSWSAANKDKRLADSVYLNLCDLKIDPAPSETGTVNWSVFLSVVGYVTAALMTRAKKYQRLVSLNNLFVKGPPKSYLLAACPETKEWVKNRLGRIYRRGWKLRCPAVHRVPCDTRENF